METIPSTLLIPVENQVRELDAKLLLSCIAAERGFPVIIGSRAYLHFQAASVPRGVYLAKSMRSQSKLMFKILRQLGHEIVAWEEEALVHPPADTYFTLRLSPVTIKMVSHIFAWGPENVELLRQYPHLPATLPIHTTGNPRGDMLRTEIRPYFDTEVQQLRRSHGDFILINTNFSDVNPFIPDVGLFLPASPGKKPKFGQAGKGMSYEFAAGLRDHKQAIMDEFIKLIPALAQAFPKLTLVVRPHPSENLDIYNALAAKYHRIKIINTGNVLPWLLAAKVMVHNGCTTGLEAYAMRVPSVSYLPVFNEYYDYDFQGLPTKLSHECFRFEDLNEMLQLIIAGELGAAGGSERERLMDEYVTARRGPLACDQIVATLEDKGYLKKQPSAPAPTTFMRAWLYTHIKAALTQLYMKRPGPNRQAYHDHRFPEICVTEIQAKIARLGKLLGRFENIRVNPHSKHLFRIESRPVPPSHD